MRIYVLFLFFIICAELFPQKLNPGDGVRVTLLNIPENISGDYYILNDGTLQLPLIGPIIAINEEFVTVKKKIEARYDSLYKKPDITVQPLFRINVLGEVKKPGLYYVTGVETISSLIALAGGETSDADLENIKMVRNGEEMNLNGKDILAQGGTVNDIGLNSGDRIYIPREWWVSAKNTTFIISGIAVLVTLVGFFIKK